MLLGISTAWLNLFLEMANKALTPDMVIFWEIEGMPIHGELGPTTLFLFIMLARTSHARLDSNYRPRGVYNTAERNPEVIPRQALYDNRKKMGALDYSRQRNLILKLSKGYLMEREAAPCSPTISNALLT